MPLSPISQQAQIQCFQAKEWSVFIKTSTQSIQARLCAIKKTDRAATLAKEKIRKEASQKQRKVKPETLFFAEYILILTTVPEGELSTAGVLEIYRARWQIELVFKRLKSILGLGHIPKKKDSEGALSWIHGKLFVAFLIETLITAGDRFSPWGYCLQKDA